MNLRSQTAWRFAAIRDRRARLHDTAASDTPIDVLMPVTGKDLVTAGLVVESVLRFVRHPIRKILVVTDVPTRARDVLERDDSFPVRVIDEAEMGFADTRFVMSNGRDRSGWLRQQLIKMSCFDLTSSGHVLLVDADTVFLRQQRFVDAEGRMVLGGSREFHRPYGAPMQTLAGVQRRRSMSFVCHHQLVERRIMQQLLATIEVRTGKPWIRGISDGLDPREGSPFSEYETYGNFAVQHYAERVRHRFAYNTVFQRQPGLTLNQLVLLKGPRHLSASAHEYLSCA